MGLVTLSAYMTLAGLTSELETRAQEHMGTKAETSLLSRSTDTSQLSRCFNVSINQKLVTSSRLKHTPHLVTQWVLLHRAYTSISASHHYNRRSILRPLRWCTLHIRFTSERTLFICTRILPSCFGPGHAPCGSSTSCLRSRAWLES